MMRMFRIIRRNLRDAFKSVFRNFSLSLASISCITITLIIVAIAVLSSYNVRNFTKLMKQDFTIVTFLDTKITNDEIGDLEKKLKSMDNIESYEFQDKEKIAEDMMKTSDIFENIMGEWDVNNNPLQNTFLIKVKDTSKINKTANSIKKLDGVTVVKYGEGIVEKLLSMFNIVEKSLIIIVLSLVFVTAFLIANTIKLTIFSRRKEIEIMRLVGASNINVELPFIIEGLFLGILGALIPIILVVYGYNIIYLNFDGKLFSPFVRLVSPEPFVYFTSLILLGLGVLVGMIGSLRAVRKHLKI